MKSLAETACEFLTAALSGFESAEKSIGKNIPRDVVNVKFTWQEEDYVVSLAKMTSPLDPSGRR
jgi:hypothetical protein